MAKESKRININMPVETLDRIDEYAEKMSINRTAAILVLISQALNAESTMKTIEDFVRLIDNVGGKQG